LSEGSDPQQETRKQQQTIAFHEGTRLEWGRHLADFANVTQMHAGRHLAGPEHED